MAWVYDKYVTDRSLYAVQDEARATRRAIVGRCRTGAAVGVAS